MSTNSRICVKSTFEMPPLPEEERNCALFQRPARTGFRNKFYSITELTQKLPTLSIDSPLYAAAVKQQVLNTRTILKDELPYCYTPSISFLCQIAQHYQDKYSIDIRVVSASEITSLIYKYAQTPGPFSIGLVLHVNNDFHVTPLILYKTAAADYHICIMDCVSSKNVLTQHLTPLLSKVPGTLWLSTGSRLSDGFSCRLESMTVLKYMLMWIKNHPSEHWLDQVKIKKDTVESIPLNTFVMPAIWAVASQLTSGIINLPHHPTAVINNKGTTYQTWYAKYRKMTHLITTIQHPITSETMIGEYSGNINMFLLLKIQKYVNNLMPSPDDHVEH